MPQLGADLQSVNDRIAPVEEIIETALARHGLAEVVVSLPGMGPVLAAEFIAGDGVLDSYHSPAALAAYAGLATAPPGIPAGFRVISSGRTVTTAAYAGSSACPPSAPCAPAPPCGPTTTRNGAAGKTHRQAAAVLSRRRVDVLWACVRDNKPYQPKRSRSEQLAVA